MNSEGEELTVVGDDYYAFLNVSREASSEDISNAYRRLSRLYHPDKHSNSQRKKEAEVLFSKTKKAYETLIDPHIRAIYDNLGTAGLETQGLELVQRTKTPQEIRREYEQLARDQEELRLQRITNPKSEVNVTINATELFNKDDDESAYLDLRDLFGLPHVEISGMDIFQYIEAPVTSRDTILMTGRLATKNGTGSGNMSCSLRRAVNSGWHEFEAGAGEGINLSYKAHKEFRPGLFGNVVVRNHLTPSRALLGSSINIGNMLGEHTMGFLTWNIGSFFAEGMETKIVRETKNRRMQAMVHFGMLKSYLSLSFIQKFPDRDAKLKLIGLAGTFGALVEYGAEKQVSKHSTFHASVTVGVPSGVMLKLRLTRASQSYKASILLCEDILPAPVIYGTIVPIIGWMAVQRFLIQPYLKRKKEEEIKQQKEYYKENLEGKRREAVAAIELMNVTVKRITDQEEAKKGLIILEAVYGHLVGDNEEEEECNFNITDVTIPLQCLVNDSKLFLAESKKSQLPGFYDPCPGENKLLRVRYVFRAVHHQVSIKDDETLRIPKQSHRIDS